jgi:hypothetical protein
MNPLSSVWKEVDHPRDRLGRFRSKWSIKGPAKELLDGILESVNPRQFTSPQQAHVYLNQRFEGGKPGSRKATQDYIHNFRAIDAEMKGGGDPPEAQALRDSMKPLDDDLMLTQSTTPQAFGLDASSLGLVEELTGKEIRNRTFTTTWMGGGTNNGGITMHILAPRGTMAAHPGGVEVILSDKTPLRVTRVDQNPDGTYRVMAVALPGNGEGGMNARDAMLEGQREGNEEAREQGLPESTEAMPAPQTAVPDRFPQRTGSEGAIAPTDVKPKSSGDSPDGMEGDRPSWVAADGTPITIGPGRTAGEVGVYQGDKLVAEAPDIEMLPQAADRAGLPEVSRWAKANKATPPDRQAASAQQAAQRAQANRESGDGGAARREQQDLDARRQQNAEAADKRFDERDKKLKKLTPAKKAAPEGEQAPERSPEERGKLEKAQLERLEKVRADQPKPKPGDRGPVSDEELTELRAPKPLKKLTPRGAADRSNDQIIEDVRAGKMTPAAAKKTIAGRNQAMAGSDSPRAREALERGVADLARVDEAKPARKKLAKAAPAKKAGPQKGGIVEWTDPDGKVTKGEIVSRQRDGSVTVQWDGGRRESGVDPNAASMQMRDRQEGESITPFKGLKKAAKKAAAPEPTDPMERRLAEKSPEELRGIARTTGADVGRLRDPKKMARRIMEQAASSDPEDPDVGRRNVRQVLDNPSLVTPPRKALKKAAKAPVKALTPRGDSDAPDRETPGTVTPIRKLAAKKATRISPSEAMRRLTDFENPPTREESHTLLEGMSAEELRGMAKEISLPGANRLSKQALRDEIVQGTSGRRRDSIAIRGFTGPRPDSPGNAPAPERPLATVTPLKRTLTPEQQANRDRIRARRDAAREDLRQQGIENPSSEMLEDHMASLRDIEERQLIRERTGGASSRERANRRVAEREGVSITEGARIQQRDIDAKREQADEISDKLERLNNEDDDDNNEIREQREALERRAREAGLTEVGNKGGFDPATMESVGPRIRSGQRVEVMRPGYEADVNGQKVLLRKAVVDTADASPPAKKLAPAAKSLPGTPRGTIMQRLTDFENPPSREEGAKLLEDVPLPALRAMGREAGIPGAGSMSGKNLRTAIYQATAGRRRDSIAIRGFRGARPDSPENDLPGMSRERTPTRQAAPSPLPSRTGNREVDVDNMVRAAYREAIAEGDKGPFGRASNGREARNGDYVTLDAIREKIGNQANREEVDAALRRLNRESDAGTAPQESQANLTPRQREAAIPTNGGQADHMVRIGNPAPKKALPSGRDEDAARRAESTQRGADLTERMRRLQEQREVRPTTAGIARTTEKATSGTSTVSGAKSVRPIAENTWGGLPQPGGIHYHADGALGSAIRDMGDDKQMDVDGEPLANVLGKIITDGVMGRTTTAEMLDRARNLSRRLPEGSNARKRLDRAIDEIDAPPARVNLPDGMPAPIVQLARDLEAIPTARKRRGFGWSLDKSLVETLEELARSEGVEQRSGRNRIFHLMNEIEDKLHNRHHESTEGKLEIDRAVVRARDALQTLFRNLARN